MDILSSTYRV